MQSIDLGLLILRLVVGLTFAGHGAQKAFGWWNGPGIDGWRGAITRMGFQPVELFLALSIGAELVGGLLLAVGLFTPLAATILIGQLVVIISKAHLPKGFWNTNGGYEYPLALGAGVIAVTFIGAGSISLDHALRLRVQRRRSCRVPVDRPARRTACPGRFQDGAAEGRARLEAGRPGGPGWPRAGVPGAPAVFLPTDFEVVRSKRNQSEHRGPRGAAC